MSRSTLLSGPRARLLAIGLASALVYALVISLRYPLLGGISKPGLVWANQVNLRLVAALIQGAAYLLLTVLYGAALWLLLERRDANDRQLIGVVVAVWLVCSAVLLCAAPAGESHDLFDYLYRGRMLAELGVSPLTTPPDSIAPQPFYGYLSWFGFVDTYGPLWEYASASVALVVGGLLRLAGVSLPAAGACAPDPAGCTALAGYITGYRLLAIGMTGVSGALIARIVRARSPQLVAAALLGWLWSPLLLLATAMGGHNDALMMPLLLLTLWLFQRRRWVFGLLALVLAAHVKLTALLLLPALAVWLVWRCGWLGALWRGALAALATAPLSWALYAPLGGWQTLPRMLHERSLYLANSPARVVYVALQDLADWNEQVAWRLVTDNVTLAFCVLAGLLLAYQLRLWDLVRGRRNAPHDDAVLWRAVAGTLLVYLLVGSYWFQHWYLLWLLAPAALLPDRPLHRTILPWFSYGALLGNLVSDFSYSPISTPLTRTVDGAQIVAAIWLPLLAAALWLAWRIWRGRYPAANSNRPTPQTAPDTKGQL